jgi:hypothetical protein
MVEKERDMNEVPVRTTGSRLINLGLAGVLLSGCGATLSGSDDLRFATTDQGLYLLARSTAIARSVCIAAGLDAARAEGRLFAEGQRPQAMADIHVVSGIQGCQMQPRALIVCQEGSIGCIPFEARRAPK